MSKPSDPRIDTSRVIHAPHGTQTALQKLAN